MTKYQLTITITTATAAQNVAAVAFAGTSNVSYPAGWTNTYGTSNLRATKLSIQLADGATGHGYVGNANVTNAGANADVDLDPSAMSGNAGAQWSVESQKECNTIDLAQYYVHGSNAGDKINISYQQA